MPAANAAALYHQPNAAKEYDDHYGSYTYLKSRITNFLSSLPPTSTIIDCGCGTGHFAAAALAKYQHKYLGIDISAPMIESCREKVPGGTFQVTNMLLFDPPEREGGYDAVIASLSLFELSRRDIETMVKKWAGWLRPAGKILLVVSAAEDQAQICGEDYDGDGLCASDYVWKFREGDPRKREMKVTLFTKVGWKRLLEGEGFRDVRGEGREFYPGCGGEVEKHYYIEASKEEGLVCGCGR